MDNVVNQAASQAGMYIDQNMAMILKTTGYVIFALLVGFIVFGFYWFSLHKYKATIFPLYGAGKDDVFSVTKPYKNKFRWDKQRTTWIPLWPLFTRKAVEPFDSEFIYPVNTVYAVDLNGTISPMRININQTETEIRAQLNPAPYYIRNWESLQYRKNNVEFAEHTFWEDNKYMIFTIIICIAMMAFVALMVWIVLKRLDVSIETARDVGEQISKWDLSKIIPH